MNAGVPSQVLRFDADRSYLQSTQEEHVAFVHRESRGSLNFSMLLGRLDRREVIAEMVKVIEERHKAWEDGSTYPQVPQLAMQWACHFITLLPADVPDPEVGAGPGGEISFEWEDGLDHILSLGIHADGIMHYAYASGNDRAHASRDLERGLPDSLLGMMRSFSLEVDMVHALS